MNPRQCTIIAGMFIAAGSASSLAMAEAPARPGAAATAAEWPQWRGPDRTGVSSETGLMKSFPSEGPKLAWTFKDAGNGYSGVAVVDGTVFAAGSASDKGDEFVFALDAATGKERWRTPIQNAQRLSPYTSSYGGGPRCTPTIDGDRLYVLGSQGDLVCLETGSGKLVWQKSLTKDLKGQIMSMWGYSESPLVDGDLLICTPGGNQGALAALDKKTGEVRWRSTDSSAKAAYSSIIIAKVGDIRHYVQLTADGPAGFDPKDGKLLWKEKVTRWNVASIPTPIFRDNCVYVTSAYGSGCGLIKLTPNGQGGIKSEVVYAKNKIENHHGGMVLVGDNVYGSMGNANSKDTLPFICQNFKTGEIAWQTRNELEPSSVIAADGKLYCYGQQTGTLVCIEANPKKFTETGRFTIPATSNRRARQGGIWTHPVIADGKLYLRDQELLYCFDLRDAKVGAH